MISAFVNVKEDSTVFLCCYLLLMLNVVTNSSLALTDDVVSAENCRG